MKRKVLVIGYICLLLIMCKLLFVYLGNNLIIRKYENGKYLVTQAKMLTDITFQKSYISNYNYGNILYKNGKYDEAIEEYEKALQTLVPAKKECKIRINYALAMCNCIEVDESNQDSLQEAINTYEEAIKILTEKSCNEHNKDAEELKEDIEKEIERLKKLQQNTSNSEEENTEESNQQKVEEETIEKKIQNIKEEATKDQRETESIYKSFYKKYEYSTGKNW
jgi:tetratricopeptide (TPR) repeat protein